MLSPVVLQKMTMFVKNEFSLGTNLEAKFEIRDMNRTLLDPINANLRKIVHRCCKDPNQ